MFATVLLAMLVGAINYNNNLVYLVTFLLAGLGLVSTVHTYRNVAHLVFRAGRVQPVFCGEDARFHIHIDNQRPFKRCAVTIEAAAAAPIRVDIEPRDSLEIILAQHTVARGRLGLGRFTVSSRYPLGLFRVWSHLDLSQTCLVYPRPGARRPLPQARASGVADSAGLGRGAEDFSGFRQYQAGDSLRHVHWKAAARTEILLTKQFAAGAQGQVWLDWEQLGGLPTESRLSQLCRWVLDAQAVGVAYGLRLPSASLQPAHGEHHRQRCLQALALFGEGNQRATHG